MNKFGYKCPDCGRGVVRPKEFLNYNTKVDNHPFTIPQAIIGVCDICGAKNFDPQERRRWIDLFNKELESKHAVLSSEDIIRIRKSLGLSMEDFAHLIGCTRQSIYNWENRKRKIPQSRMADLLLKLINDRIYKRDKIDVLEFLLAEAKKLSIVIKIKEDIASIVSSGDYEYTFHPSEQYAENYKKTEEPSGFSPKLKITA